MVIKMKITVLGAGAYGTALSTVLEENKNEVTIWSAFKDEIDYLQTNHESPRLKGIKLSESFKFTTDLKEAITNKDLIVIATPTGAVDEVTKQMQEYYDGTPICAISKGIEQDTCLFVYDVIKKYLNTDEIAVMSGPSFAIDVANKVPVGLTLAGQNKKLSIPFIKLLQTITSNYVNHMISLELKSAEPLKTLSLLPQES